MENQPSKENYKENKAHLDNFWNKIRLVGGTIIGTVAVMGFIYSLLNDKKNTEIDLLERHLLEEKSKKDEQNENLKSLISLLQAQIEKQEKAIDDFDKKITAIEKDKTACNDKLETFLKERDLLKERLSLQSAKAKELEEKLHKSKEIQNPKVQKKDNDQDNRKLDYYFKDEQRNK